MRMLCIACSKAGLSTDPDIFSGRLTDESARAQTSVSGSESSNTAQACYLSPESAGALSRVCPGLQVQCQRGRLFLGSTESAWAGPGVFSRVLKSARSRVRVARSARMCYPGCPALPVPRAKRVARVAGLSRVLPAGKYGDSGLRLELSESASGGPGLRLVSGRPSQPPGPSVTNLNLGPGHGHCRRSRRSPSQLGP